MNLLSPFLDLVTHPWVSLIAGFALLIFGANWLVDGAVAIAHRCRVSILFIGLTVVAFGTSAPELAVNIVAATKGNTALSFGNVVGSNIANVGFVIGVGALCAPIVVHGRVIKRELPGLIVISLVMFALALLPWNWPAAGLSGLLNQVATLEGTFSRGECAIMLALFLMFMVFWYRMGKRDEQDPFTVEASERAEAIEGGSMGRAWFLFTVGLVGLIAGGQATEAGATELAKSWGWGPELIGMTVVAVATSLPEAITVVVAALKRHADLAVGNVVGSNVFNLLLVLAVTGLIEPVPLPPGGVFDLTMMVLMTGILLGVAVINRPRNVNRIEGFTLLTLWAAYLLARIFWLR